MSEPNGLPGARPPALHVTASEVGFVGTPAGMTGAQLRSVQIMLMEYGPVELHFAGRQGADVQVAEMADRLRLWRMVHPGIGPEGRPACPGDVEFPAKPEEERFSGIVDAVGVLFAAPRAGTFTPGCWTWWSVARAREVGRPVVLVRPDGSTSRQDGRTRR